MLLACAYLFCRIKTGIHAFINLYCKMYCHIYKYIKHFFSFQKSYFLFEIKKMNWNCWVVIYFWLIYIESNENVILI